MSNRGSTEVDLGQAHTEPKKFWTKRNKKIALITGAALVAVIVVVVLVVTLTGDDDPDDSTTTPTTTSTTTSTTTTEDPINSSSDATTVDPISTDPPEVIEINLEDILNGVLSTRRFSSRWVDGQNILRKDADGNLELYDIVADSSTTLLDKDNELFKNAYTYKLSPNAKHLIVGYDPEKGFRHSYGASYSVVELMTTDASSKAAGDETKIFIGSEDDKLTLVDWAPTGDGIVIVFENNIYYKPNLASDPIAITTDGNDKIFNGVPDWVYEEEIFGSNSALRFSPDGKKLAYIRFDDDGVQTFEYTHYGEPGTPEAQYPTNMVITYPKVGTTNPTVQLFQVELPLPDQDANSPVQLHAPSELSAEEHIITTLSWADDNHVIATWMNRTQNHAIISTCDVQSEEGQCVSILEKISEEGWVELFRAPINNADGSKFALIISQDQGDDAGGYRHLTLIETATGAPTILTKGKYVVTQIIHWDTILNYIFYAANTEEDSRVLHIYAIKAESDAVSQCLTCDLDYGNGDYKYFSASFSNDGNVFGLNALGPDIPRADIYSYTEEGGKITLVHELVWETNEAVNDLITELDKPFPTVEYDVIQFDGYTAQVQMVLPGDIDRTAVKKYPVLVNVYGGPDSYAVSYQWSTNWGTYLVAAKDIIYVKIDGRGSALRGDKLLNYMYLKLGTVEIEDQIETTKRLADKYKYMDSDHMAIWGWSYGGYAAGLALAKDNDDVFKCAVSVAPVTDWTYYDTMYTERYMGLPTTNAVGYANSRLSTLYEEFKGKNYFLIHGTLDDNVHYQQAMALSRTLEKKAVLFKQMSYPDEDHSLSGVQKHLYNTLERYFSECFELDH